MSTLMTADVLKGLAPFADAGEREASFNQLLVEIRARRAEFGAQKHISPDIIAAFVKHGVYRALVPRRFGGNEGSARNFCEMIERIAQADGSAGWVASFGMGVTYLAALPVTTLAEIYQASPDVIFAGGIFPPQPARRVDGGFEVSGRWSFASGCMGATVIGVGIAPVDEGAAKPPLPRMAVMPRELAQIDRTWNVMGLVGTGSHDLLVDKVVVPEDWTFVRGGASNLDEPMFRYPALSFAAQVLAVVGLGIARGAIEEVRAIGSKMSITGAPRLGERPHTQTDLAVCEAKLRAARSFFYESIDAAWNSLMRGDPVSADQTSMLRLSSAHAARVGAEVARSAQMMVGTTGIYETSPLSMQVRDAMVVTQHAFLGDMTYQNAGAMMFGLKPAPGYL